MIPTPWMHCFSQFGSSRTDIIRADTSQDPDQLPTEGVWRSEHTVRDYVALELLADGALLGKACDALRCAF